MIAWLIQLVLGRKLVLYNKHRQTIPIIQDAVNRKKFFFVEMSKIWGMIPFRSTQKVKFKVMYWILSLINPKYIIDINWITSYHTLFLVWTRKHKGSSFVVFQHGSYRGGIVKRSDHRYTKCDIFFTWGDYFTKLFQSYNAGKRVRIASFGNPVFNQFDRSHYRYSEEKIQKILLVPSVIKEDRLKALASFSRHLETKGYVIVLKEHNLQNKYGEEIAHFAKEGGNIVDLLSEHRYDLIITDHSSVLLDAIFFRNRVLIFSAPESTYAFSESIFSDYLGNLHDEYDLEQEQLNVDISDKVNLSRQEELLHSMIYLSDNNLSTL
jgi:hypothetical protein